jgi:hypothetical protein
LIVGLTGVFNVAWIRGVRFHGLVLKFEKMIEEFGKKKTAGGPAVGLGVQSVWATFRSLDRRGGVR